MTDVRRHNPVLRARLSACLGQNSPEELLALLAGLSNTDFRTSGYLLAEELLPAVPGSAVFWTFFCGVVPADSRAYLGTFLKAAVRMYAAGRLELSEACLADFARRATPIDRRKVLEALLPVVRTDGEVFTLLALFCEDKPEAKAAFLLKAGTLVCYYRLFQVLKMLDAGSDTLRRYVLLLMRRGDRLSFNMAGAVCRYFDIHDQPGTFSLRLPPYQLSRLDDSFDSFSKILTQ